MSEAVTGAEAGAEAGPETVGQGSGSPGPDGIRIGSGVRGWRSASPIQRSAAVHR
jgi:hypothetical protein